MDIVFKYVVIWYWIQLHLIMLHSQTTMLVLPPCMWTIPYYRYAILSILILILFKTTRTWVYVASSLEALVGISKYLYFRKTDQLIQNERDINQQDDVILCDLTFDFTMFTGDFDIGFSRSNYENQISGITSDVTFVHGKKFCYPSYAIIQRQTLTGWH